MFLVAFQVKEFDFLVYPIKTLNWKSSEINGNAASDFDKLTRCNTL